MSVVKYTNNPVITIGQVQPTRPDFEVIGVFNAGATVYKGETVLLLRVAERPKAQRADCVLSPVYDARLGETVVVELHRDDPEYDFDDPRVIYGRGQSYLTSMSHLRLARSADGYRFAIEDKPALCAQDEYEAFGVEDPRITPIDGQYYITYSTASQCGSVTRLARTADFESYERLGTIFYPDNKDVVIFPQRIGGKYYALHRPSASAFGKLDLWIASSPDLVSWGDHKRVAAIRPGKFDGGRMGAGAVPFLTKQGWLEIYHGATEGNRYCLGAMLLDRDEPWKVLKRSEIPLVEPTEPYELSGFFGNVVFTCGHVESAGRVKLYYGASDDCVAVADMDVQDVLEHMN